jgi:hypothetical protein
MTEGIEEVDTAAACLENRDFSKAGRPALADLRRQIALDQMIIRVVG